MKRNYRQAVGTDGDGGMGKTTAGGINRSDGIVGAAAWIATFTWETSY